MRPPPICAQSCPKTAGNVLQGHMLVSRQSVQKVTKVAKVKGQSTGRTYTSKYRGVHQTFPTKRWEAQFRCTDTYPDCTHFPLLALCTRTGRQILSLRMPRVSPPRRCYVGTL